MNDPNSIKEEVVTGIFDLLKLWWVWASIVVAVGFGTGTLTQHNIVTIFNIIANLVK